MRRAPLLALVALALLLPAVAAAPSPGLPMVAGDPDVPAATEPVAVVTVLQDEVWSFTAGFRGRVVDVPEGWSRAVLVFHQKPLGDPWDRTFAASIGGVEVLRGTTPRVDMTVRKDVTRYAALLPQGGEARVEGYTDTYVGAMSVTLTLEFYDDPTALLVPQAADDVVGVARFAGLCTGGAFTRTVDFGDGAPASAELELHMSGHGAEEFWYGNSGRPRVVHVDVDGVEVARVVLMPYHYAFLGFADGATGHQNERTLLMHKVMWWTAQEAADRAGVRWGTGEVPPYRVLVQPEHLGLLSGEREVRVSIDPIAASPQQCVWTTSVSAVLDG